MFRGLEMANNRPQATLISPQLTAVAELVFWNFKLYFSWLLQESYIHKEKSRMAHFNLMRELCRRRTDFQAGYNPDLKELSGNNVKSMDGFRKTGGTQIF